MYFSAFTTTGLAATLRQARRARGMSITTLAVTAGVSPRLVSEFERGQRPHVSLETALRLLSLVDARVHIGDIGTDTAEAKARAARAEHRRRTWVGHKTTLREQADPAAPDSPQERLAAVAQASRLAASLQQASRAHYDEVGSHDAAR